MTRHFIFLILTLLCGIAEQASGQLVFDPSSWDFGTIRETDGPVSHTFTGENRGSSPLVILDVVTSCGCTAPRFSRRPILPGQKTEITVTYDPANRPGIFDKSLTVYSSQRQKVATLSVRGSVIPRPKSIEERYPVDAGGGLRLTSTLNTFAFIRAGQHVQGAFGYVNTADHPVRLELRPVKSSGMLRLDTPTRIAPAEQGSINVAYLNPAEQPRYGTIRDALEVFVDGRSNGTTLVSHGIGVDPAPGADEKTRPHGEISENILKFGSVKRTEAPRRLAFTLSNTGTADLIVRAVEGAEHVATTLSAGMRITPGGSLRAEVTMDPGGQDYGILSDHLIVVTNDPERPMRRIRVTAIIEE